jgi:predicted nucleotidyltransferase
MYQNKYILDNLGTKNTIRVLRYLYQNLNKQRSISRISEDLNISRANIHRGLKDLDRMNMIRRSRSKNRSLVRIDTSSRIASPFFSLFNEERYRTVDPDVKDLISLLISKKDISQLQMAVLFGSHARGTATERSDIDLLIVSKNKDPIESIKKDSRKYLPEKRLEIHHYFEEDLTEPKDLVVIDSILFGIAILGDQELFHHRTSIESIDRSYLVGRIRSAQENMDRSIKLEGEAKEYFEKVAWVTLGEVGSILEMGETLPKVEISRQGSFDERTRTIKEELAKRGERIWLT